MKKDLSRFLPNTLEHAIQDALLDSFEIFHEKKNGSLAEKLTKIRQLYETEKEYISFELKEKINNSINKLTSVQNDPEKALELLKDLKRNVLVIDLFYLERLINLAG